MLGSWVRAPNGSPRIIRKKLNFNDLRIFFYPSCTTFAPLSIYYNPMPMTSRTSENQHACSLVMETIVKTTMAINQPVRISTPISPWVKGAFRWRQAPKVSVVSWLSFACYHHLIAHNLIHIMVRSSLGSAPSRCYSTSVSMASMTWRAFS